LARQIQCDLNFKPAVIQPVSRQAPYCALIPIYDYWTDEMKSELVIEMKLIRGMDGFDFAQTTPSNGPQPHTAEYYALLQYSLISIAQSLNHMHAKCVLHRDVKIDNTLFDQDEQRFYLTDFGLSCSILQQNECSNLQGTRSYYDPLVLNSKVPFPNETSDPYALGQTFYELVTRQN
jgi:serine/threonine protein kinase